MSSQTWPVGMVVVMGRWLWWSLDSHSIHFDPGSSGHKEDSITKRPWQRSWSWKVAAPLRQDMFS